jgi:hypothetical protein
LVHRWQDSKRVRDRGQHRVGGRGGLTDDGGRISGPVRHHDAPSDDDLSAVPRADYDGTKQKLPALSSQSGRRVYYSTLADLITSLEEAQAASRLARRVATLSYPSLLVVDEIGYLPVTRTGAVLFFQLVSRRYEHASTVFTSNKSLTVP